ncbi:Sur7p KNAG_0G00330 [Huiozyma naganishii CBS 8797]|uniref:Uncharacterized protein n=1 Tax=Huiozyma naganishii (strain ATCC MYA-139 / BCRC 22969 / CBS 8797 / KCTC 17520 / NBRC 10181 / NCYC 3082 / Yp74L-3) TaxID=1071383 RepID=J7R8A2_HUIN7|nr:hypothetical protein KNAG_0G00330 [Kazachstania naganishii CBS 8797]CCK71090.1 hypothetical protein KNAG_0G00330 [Kazachstania naganishii CBS 8797]
MGVFLKTFLRFLTLLLFAGNTLLLILIVLSGAITSTPIDRFYWVEADTAGIPNAGDTTRWTFWGACTVENGITTCDRYLQPAAPISPVDNFHTKEEVPHSFIAHRDRYYYLSRFSFCFIWIALAFIGIAFLLFVLSWFSQSISQVVLILSIVGCIFDSVAVILQTAVSVLARNAFHGGDRDARISAPLLGIAWASLVCSVYNAIMSGYWWNTAKKNMGSSSYVNDGFFHREKDNYNVPEPIEAYPTTAGTATAVPSTFPGNASSIDYDEENAAAAAAGASPRVAAPATANAGVASPENTHKGIRFFTVRQQNKTVPDDDDSV